MIIIVIIMIIIIILIIIITTRVPSCKLHERELLHAMSNQKGLRFCGGGRSTSGHAEVSNEIDPHCIGVSGNYRASSKATPRAYTCICVHMRLYVYIRVYTCI